MAHETLEAVDEYPEDGVLISGLYIDGARWDRENLVVTDQFPGKMAETMPVI